MTQSVMTFVANRRVVEIVSERVDAPRSIAVTIRVDGEPRWSSEEPGWRDLGIGEAADRTYFWSARRLVLVPMADAGEALVIDVDEDILVAFAIEQRFLLVCETSVRLVSQQTERSSRLELPEVVDVVRWQDDVLEVRDVAGATHRIAIADEGLLIVS